MSGGVEIGTQMISNAIQGERITNISWKKVGIAAGEGFITSGASTGVRIAVKIGAAVAQSTVDNHDKGAAEIVKGTAVNLAAGSIAKGGAKLTNKIGNKTLNRMSNKMVQSKNAITKSVKKLPVSTKTARNAAAKIQSAQKSAAKAVRNTPGTITEIGTAGVIDAKTNNNGKKRR